MIYKDCIHYEACKDIYYPMSTYDEEAKAFDESDSCDGCQFYSDKSRYIELPCKVGDTAYADFSGKGYYYDECKVKHIEFNSDWTEPLFTLICYEKADYRTYWLSDFGKEWFLEPQERVKKKKRKALKERERGAGEKNES